MIDLLGTQDILDHIIKSKGRFCGATVISQCKTCTVYTACTTRDWLDSRYARALELTSEEHLMEILL